MKLRSLNLRFALAAVAALSVGGLVATTAMPAHAQAAKRQKRGGAKREPVELKAFKAVGPTADGETKFEALFAKFDADRKNLQATTTDKKALRPQMMDLEKKFHSDADALLTPDQQTKYHQGLVTIPIMENFDRNLMLTPDEKTKIEPILADYAQKTEGMKAKEKKSATEEVKPKIREILSADQQTKFDLMPNLAGGGGRRNAVPAVPPAVAPPATVPPVAPPAAPPTTPAAP